MGTPKQRRCKPAPGGTPKVRVESAVDAITDDVAYRIMELTADGTLYRDIPDVPKRWIWQAYLDRHQEMAELWETARAAYAESLMDQTVAIADSRTPFVEVHEDGDGNVTKKVYKDDSAGRKLQLDIRARHATNLAPKYWGKKVVVGGSLDLGEIIKMSYHDGQHPDHTG